MSRSFFSSLLDLLFPPACGSCGELLPFGTEEALCPACAEAWEQAMEEICPACGRAHRLCTCPVGDVPQMHLVAYHPGRLSPPDCLLLGVKEKKRTRVFSFLGRSLAQRIGDAGNDAVFTFVPRSPKKKNRFGVDQAQEMATAAAAHFGTRALPLLLSRDSADQKTLTVAERAASAAAKYRLNLKTADAFRGRHVLLFDDIVTTGSTVLACAAILRRNGAASVTVVSAAKTGRHGGTDQSG